MESNNIHSLQEFSSETPISYEINDQNDNFN